jgi:hypothetical protein
LKTILNKISSSLSENFKYIYLAIFFTLLAGIFHPLITGNLFNDFLWGVIVLTVGLAGVVLLYKSLTSEKRQIIYFGGGFGIIFLALILIFQITGRV